MVSGYVRDIKIPITYSKDIPGGILAEEMGLGKTVETIHTILSNQHSNYQNLTSKNILLFYKNFYKQSKQQITQKIKKSVSLYFLE